MGLIDSRECSLDLRILKLALAPIIFYRGFRCLYRRACLRYLRLVVVVFEFNNQVSLMHLLVIGNLYIPNDSGDLGA